MVDQGDAAPDLYDVSRKRVTVSLAPNVPSGIYTVGWTSRSAEDGEADQGQFSFTIATGAAGTPLASPVASPAVSPQATPGV